MVENPSAPGFRASDETRFSQTEIKHIGGSARQKLQFARYRLRLEQLKRRTTYSPV